MKLNLTVDRLIATVTVILSILVFVDHCSARLRPMASSASLSKVGNLAADHLSALQQTSRKITKSSVVGINWKNVLVLAGLKAGLVGAKLVKKKVAYKKLKGLKAISGFDHGQLNGYPFYNFNQPYAHPVFDAKFNKLMPYASPYDSNYIHQTGHLNDWSPTPRSIDKYAVESYSPVIWRKSSLCTEHNHCADYLTSSSITYQLLGTSLPLQFPVLLPAPTALKPPSASKVPQTSPQSNHPFVLTWVKSPSISGGNNELSSSSSSSSTNSLSNGQNANNNPQSTKTNNLNSNLSPNLSPTTIRQPPEQLSNFILQEKEDDKYHHLDQFSTTNYTDHKDATQFKDAIQFKDPMQFKDSMQFKDPMQYKDSETPSDQLVAENSNKLSTWSV